MTPLLQSVAQLLRSWFLPRKQRTIHLRPSTRLVLEHLENRLVPASFSESGIALAAILAANESVSVLSASSGYTLALTGGTWSGTDTSTPGVPADFVVTFTQTSYQVKGVKITVDTGHDLGNWEEIDAVRLFSPNVTPRGADNAPTITSAAAPATHGHQFRLTSTARCTWLPEPTLVPLNDSIANPKSLAD